MATLGPLLPTGPYKRPSCIRGHLFYPMRRATGSRENGTFNEKSCNARQGNPNNDHQPTTNFAVDSPLDRLKRTSVRQRRRYACLNRGGGGGLQSDILCIPSTSSIQLHTHSQRRGGCEQWISDGLLFQRSRFAGPVRFISGQDSDASAPMGCACGVEC
jgi:hypothetical protein